MTANAKRGYVPEDERNFSPSATEKMRTASRHICYLINEGYDLKQAAAFVGNHFLLSERQRLALMRCVAAREQLAGRRNREVSVGQLAGQEVWIDGFNIIITMEVMLSDSILLTGMDGCIRDLAALRGTYRIIPETEEGIRLIFDLLQGAEVRKANILLDEPVSNSGRLKTLIAEVAEACSLDTDIQIIKDVDRSLYAKDNVITSDSIILDRCGSWFNLTAELLNRRNKQGIRITDGPGTAL